MAFVCIHHQLYNNVTKAGFEVFKIANTASFLWSLIILLCWVLLVVTHVLGAGAAGALSGEKEEVSDGCIRSTELLLTGAPPLPLQRAVTQVTITIATRGK